MKHLIVLLFLLSPAVLFAQEKSYIKKGNELYNEKKFKEAEADYRKSVEKKSQNVPANFNLGDALYKQKKYADAGRQFDKLAESQNNKPLAAAAYHNMGNSLLENNKLEESIEAYKKALLNNPKDDETRYNLAYAEEKLKKQQQNKKDQQDKNQNNKDQNKQNQQKKDDKNKDQQNKDQNKQNQDKDKQNQQNGQQPNQISKEDAQRMLDALNNDEKQTQDKLKNKKFKAGKTNITKDW